MTSSKRSSLAAAIKQGKPFKSPQQELYISIAKTASELSLSIERFLRPYGLTQIAYNVLRILQGSAPEGLGRNEISERMITAAPDMTRLLDRMERDGLVVRTRGQEDKRQVATTITQAGKDLLTRVEAPLLKLHAEQFAKLSAAEVRAATQWLGVLRDANAEKE
jgi:DNA-binding MarR family transcriptional regulator